MRLWLLVHNSKANVPMKLNAPDDLLSNGKTFLTSLHNGLIKHFLRFSLPLFCWLIMMIKEISYFAEKLSM